MIAIMKRELKSFFTSPIGYVCEAVLLALFGYYYYVMMMYGGSSSYITSFVFGNMFMWSMMIIPIITMRGFSDERRNKTDQALLTAPVSVSAIVWGKFLASFSVYFIAMTAGLLPAVALSFFSSPNWALILANYIASLLYGGALISIGLFLSSLTESQLVAAITTFGVSIVLMVIDQLKSMVSADFLKTIIGWISFNSRYNDFTNGIFNIASIVFFLSVVAVFTFLTARKLESRRWS